MRVERRYPPLSERIVVLLVYLVLSYCTFMWASGRGLPTGGLESVWLLSAAALWFLTLISAPWFLPPRDSLVNALGAASILVTIDLDGVLQFQRELNALRWIAVGYSVFVVGLSLGALFLHDQDPRSADARLLFQLNSIFGRGELLYTPGAIISVLGAYQASHAAMAWLVVLWVLFIVGHPIELTLAAWRQWRSAAVANGGPPVVGLIDRIDDPNIIRVRLAGGVSWKPGSLHIAAMPDGDQQFVLALFAQKQETEVMATGLCVAPLQEPIAAKAGQVFASHDAARAREFIENLSGAKDAALVGFAVENSTIAMLRFEVALASSLEEGDVVFARINGRQIFYQIVNAETAEESFDKNPRGTHIVGAAQLGSYDRQSGFAKFHWLPAMNTPLFAAKNLIFDPPIVSDREFIIGKVPSTNVGVPGNIDNLVEYHAAILGATGTGKTELALDIVRHAVVRGTKVFCVDFTGDYRQRLSDLSPIFPGPTEKEAAELESRIFAVDTGNYGGRDQKPALKATLDTLRASTTRDISAFLECNDRGLAILELTELANTKATLRLTEVYLSAIMSWAQEHRKARQILIVLEEAHTIIPEVHGSGFDSDTQSVVSRIGQIALQGRKYGVGLLVVTQRTALVSKTILSQCNTFFTHTLIDQTSLNFLESVYSGQHARLVPNLAHLQFLAVGKALRAERPILLHREFDPAKKEASERLRRPLPIREMPPRDDVLEDLLVGDDVARGAS